MAFRGALRAGRIFGADSAGGSTGQQHGRAELARASCRSAAVDRRGSERQGDVCLVVPSYRRELGSLGTDVECWLA
eukprot:6346537-Alexandrium_andersonii.AAC.1